MQPSPVDSSPRSPRLDARSLAASPLARPPSRKLGEPEFARIPDYPWHGRVSNGGIVALFVAAILIPFVPFWLSLRGQPALQENRNLAPRPQLGWENREHWAEGIDAYYRDHFGFRAHLIRWENLLRATKLAASNKDLIIGRDRWAFYVREGNAEDHLGLRPLSPAQLNGWKRYLEQRHNMLAADGIKYLFVVAPDKESIYPEQLPDYFQRALRPGHLSQLLDHLQRTQSPVAVLDLRAALRAEKAQGLVYFPQDTHWNGRGFFLANQQIVRYAKQHWFPELLIPSLHPDYAIEEHPWEGGEWNLFGLPDQNAKFRSDFLVRKTPAKAQLQPGQLPKNWPPTPASWNRPLIFAQPQASRRVVVVHDSFMRTGCPDRDHIPLAEHFGHSLFVGIKPDLAQLMSVVDQEHPDLVIDELVERHIQGEPTEDTSDLLGLD